MLLGTCGAFFGGEPALVGGDLALDVHAQVVGAGDALLLADSAIGLPGLCVETEDAVRHGVAGRHGKRLADAYAIRRPAEPSRYPKTHMRCLCVSGEMLVAFCICDSGLEASRRKESWRETPHAPTRQENP